MIRRRRRSSGVRTPLRVGAAALAAFLAGGTFVALSGTAAAQATNRDLIDGLENQLLYVALPLTVFVLMILVYAAVKFHDNDDPQPTPEDPALEITWTVATAIILLFVGLAAYSVLVNPYVSPPQPADVAGSDEGDNATAAGAGGGNPDGFEDVEDLPETDDEEIFVTGYQWEWEATYRDANVTTRDTIVMPADEDVTMWLTSEDVIHSLFLRDFGAKQDAFPGYYTRLRTNAYETGEFDARCAEFCGAGHSRMDGTVVVVEPQEYEDWLEENEDEREADPPEVS
ncbi:cytochrome c oxidase subunit II [Natrialbaceae archaeon GCM10025810]|uniref:cytochrome c oxidase subunit II n=1 Tax=Halovalidus salilacus TaxID=3075124 RepID=UPI003613077E